MKLMAKPRVELTGLPRSGLPLYWMLIPWCLALMVACGSAATIAPTSTPTPTPTPVPGVNFRVGDRVELRLPRPEYGEPASPNGVKTIKSIVRVKERLVISFDDGTSISNGGSDPISEEELQSYLTPLP